MRSASSDGSRWSARMIHSRWGSRNSKARMMGAIDQLRTTAALDAEGLCPGDR
jgi:hypothetical protein